MNRDDIERLRRDKDIQRVVAENIKTPMEKLRRVVGLDYDTIDSMRQKAKREKK